MAKVTRSTLKSYFNTGDQPTESEFIDVFDSTLNLSGSNAITGSLIISGSTKDTADGLPVVLRVHGNIIADQYIVSSSVTEITTQTISGSTEFGNTVDDTHDFTGDITASRHISASGTITADSMTAVSASFLHITASTVDVDANTIVIGGTPFNKGDVDNLKLGRPLTLDTAVEGFDSIIRPAAIMSQLNSDDYQKWTVEGRLGTVIGGALIHDIKNDGDVSSISLGKADASTRVSVTGSLEISGSSTLTNWGNFRNRLHQDRFAFEVSTNPFAAGGFKQHQTPTGNAYTGSAPHLHFMLSGSGQTGVGLLNPEHTLHVSASSNTFQALYVDGDSTFIGNTSASGTLFGRFAHINGHITASDTFSQFGNPINSNISASGTLFGQFANITGHITASGNISASGTIIASQLTGSLSGNATGLSGTPSITVNQIIAATISSSGKITGLTGSFGRLEGLSPITVGSNITASGNISASGTIVANSFTGTFNGAFSGSAQIDHDSTTNFVANEHIDHSGVTITAGDGLTGGGTIEATRTLNVVGGTGVTANANDIEIGQDVATTADVTFNHVTSSGNISASGTITANAFVGNITGDLTGEADTVATIAGLAPNTATTQATQGNITSLGTLTNVSSSGTGSFGAVRLPDNGRLFLGTGNDLQIYHDSSNSYIDDLGTGNLLIRGANNVEIEDSDGNNMARFKKDNSVELYYDGVKKLETLSTGVTIPGELSASGVLTGASLSLPNITSAAATDALFYTINGKRVEVRSQTQVGIAADTGWTLELRNTSIEPNSLIVANVIGGEGGILTGSVVTANVIAANTASLNFFNTGLAIVDNATFTASLAIF